MASFLRKARVNSAMSERVITICGLIALRHREACARVKSESLRNCSSGSSSLLRASPRPSPGRCLPAAMACKMASPWSLRTGRGIPWMFPSLSSVVGQRRHISIRTSSAQNVRGGRSAALRRGIPPDRQLAQDSHLPRIQGAGAAHLEVRSFRVEGVGGGEAHGIAFFANVLEGAGGLYACSQFGPGGGEIADIIRCVAQLLRTERALVPVGEGQAFAQFHLEHLQEQTLERDGVGEIGEAGGDLGINHSWPRVCPAGE